MLFQNSWEVPLGITAMVSFFESFVASRWQLTDATTTKAINRKDILRMMTSLVNQFIPSPFGRGKGEGLTTRNRTPDFFFLGDRP